MKKRILCLIVFIMVCFSSFAQSSGDSYKINLTNFITWDKERDIYNPATGKLTLNKGYGGGGVWFSYTGNYNYLELKYKTTFPFKLEVEYSDKTVSKIVCKKNSNIAYIKLEPKKVVAVKIQKIQAIELSVTLESLMLVQKKSVIDNPKKEPIIDKKEGNFNSSMSAIDLVKQMKIGWGLGGSLDLSVVFAGWTDGRDDLNYIRSLGTETEICWNVPYTTKEIINFPKSQGYSSIRIPITWYNHIIDNNYTIDPEWMARVKEIVDWSIEAGYYVIINSHHDVEENICPPLKRTNGYVVNSDAADIAESKRFLKAIWTQISTAFNGSYDEHLIFEVMNEPRNIDHHQWTPGIKLSWIDTSSCKECIADYKTLNELNQLCLDTIRASGGNNANRFVMIPSMCAGKETALSNYFELPKDSANNKLILSVHDYVLGGAPEFAEQVFTQEIKQNLANFYSQLNKKFIKKGIPVVVGETSAFRILIPKQERIKWISYFSKLTSSYGIALIYWDAPPPADSEYYYDQFDRANLKFYEPDFVQAMLKNWKSK